MEDNEFEEVTIISHTDRPQRVFSEKSIEKLKDQVSLEIVKEINGTEDKTYNDDPRLAPGLRELEKLKQDHFGEGEGKILPTKPIFFISRVAGESGQYLLGAEGAACFSNGTDSVRFQPKGKVRNLLYWGEYLVIVAEFKPLIAYDSGGNMVLETEERVCDSTVFQTVNKIFAHIHSGKIMIVDRDLKLQTKFICKGFIQDFFVCPKTETITTLAYNIEYNIQHGERTLPIPKLSKNSRFHILKKMYSDHFLVGESVDKEHIHRLHLGCLHKLTILHAVEFQQYAADPKLPSWKRQVRTLLSQNIRLLAPRQGINCFFVGCTESIELFCEYRLKLYHLKTLEIKGRKVHFIGIQRDDFWMVTVGNSTILSVRVDFSKCPALQL